MKIKNTQYGLTLLELMIAVSLFTMVMLISTTMFIRAMDNQKQSIAGNNLQQGLNYAISIMSNEAYGVIQDPTSCPENPFICSDATYFFCSHSSDTELTFRNASAQCVHFMLENDANSIPRIRMVRGADSAYITPVTMRVTSLNFNASNTDDPVYPIGAVTMSITAQSLAGVEYPETLRVQTSIATAP